VGKNKLDVLLSLEIGCDPRHMKTFFISCFILRHYVVYRVSCLTNSPTKATISNLFRQAFTFCSLHASKSLNICLFIYLTTLSIFQII
jgi:hypothetical protein